jgi:hypothetical protein
MQDEHGRILILGGTGEAMKLAAALAARPDLPALLSFAGRTKTPLLPSIPSRIGGFGGVDGLAAYLTTMRTPLVIDATHPFAAQMSQNAAQACARLGVPRLTFTRKHLLGNPGYSSRTAACTVCVPFTRCSLAAPYVVLNPSNSATLTPIVLSTLCPLCPLAPAISTHTRTFNRLI